MSLLDKKWTWTFTKFRSESNNVYLYTRGVSILLSVIWSSGYRVRLPCRQWRDEEVYVVSNVVWERYFFSFKYKKIKKSLKCTGKLPNNYLLQF